VLIVLCAISGASPLVGVFGSMAGIATVGIVMLMLLTSIAAAVFFFKAPHLAPGRAMTTRWAPVAATALLAFILYLVLANFTTVTGLGDDISTLLAIIPMAAFAIRMVAIKKTSLASLGNAAG
jgi:hypothetical protein